MLTFMSEVNVILQQVMPEIESAKRFGVRQLQDGTKLYGRVPHVAPDAWFHLCFAPLSEERLDRLECVLQRPIPSSYRDFLAKVSNGLDIFCGSLSLDGLREDFTRSGDAVWQPFSIGTPNLDERLPDALQEHFFIGGYQDDASLLYMCGKQVCRCSRTSVRALNVWTDLADMLVSEVARLGTLFDALGRRKYPNQSTAPVNAL